MKREMTREEAYRLAMRACEETWNEKTCKQIKEALEQEPCEDAVSLGVFEQVMWERDVAIDQLKELGYGFGEKKRTGRWIESAINQIKGCDDIGHFYVCTECGRYINLRRGEKLSDYPYCHCGAKMVEPQESETGMSEEISREEIAALLARGSEEITREQACDTLQNAAWLGTNEDRERIERAVELLCGEPCEDTISRKASIAALKKHFSDDDSIDTECGAYWHHGHVIDVLQGIPSVTPMYTEITLESAIDYLNSIGWIQKHDKELTESAQKQRTGHWIEHPEIKTSAPEYLMFYECSECGDEQCFCKSDIHRKHFCNNCGAKMVEPQERNGV